jgi:hypothetical protein
LDLESIGEFFLPVKRKQIEDLDPPDERPCGRGPVFSGKIGFVFGDSPSIMIIGTLGLLGSWFEEKGFVRRNQPMDRGLFLTAKIP